MKEKYNQEKFFNSTLSKIENYLTKFIFETNFSNIPSLYLREEISKFKMKKFKRSNSQNDYQPYYHKVKQKVFPFIKKIKDPDVRNKNSSIFIPIVENKNIISGKQDINL